MSSLKDKVLFVTGASRGIGKAIALRAAADGAKIVIAAKTDTPHPKLPGTIHTAAQEVEDAGGTALAVKTDIRFEDQVEAAVDQAVQTFGGIDILVNNASALYLAGTLDMPVKRFDLLWSVNARGTFLCCQKCLPHLKQASNPHILMLSPPLNMNSHWFRNHAAYTISKYGMSMCVLGMAEEFREEGVAVNALWPKTVINTAALSMLWGMAEAQNTRKPEIVAAAAHLILTRDSRVCSGSFFLDEELLESSGIVNLDDYSVEPGAPLLPDLFVDS